MSPLGWPLGSSTTFPVSSAVKSVHAAVRGATDLRLLRIGVWAGGPFSPICWAAVHRVRRTAPPTLRNVRRCMSPLLSALQTTIAIGDEQNLTCRRETGGRRTPVGHPFGLVDAVSAAPLQSFVE